MQCKIIHSEKDQRLRKMLQNSHFVPRELDTIEAMYSKKLC